jgi:hypothetical protein
MREKPFRIHVGFATENFIAVDGELIEKIFLLARRLPWHAIVPCGGGSSLLVLAMNPGRATVKVSSFPG